MSDHRTDVLSAYLDGELGGAERDQLEAHLGECEECSALLDDLRRVVARTGALEDRPPTAELWSGILERIGATESVIDLERHRLLRRESLDRKRVSFSLPQLVAASITLIVFSAGTAWLTVRSEAPSQNGVPAVATPGLVSTVPVSTFADEKYGAAIAELERILAEYRDQLDTATVRVLEENLMTIDRAIAQARRALAQDPASSYLNDYLAGTMRQKLEFLRQAASMVGAAS